MSHSDPHEHLPESLPRRTFLWRLVASPPLALAATQIGCTPIVRSVRLDPAASVAVRLSDFPELARPGGALKLRVGPQQMLYLRHGPSDEYRAFSAVCTHQGCLVDPTATGFRCPCHGSVYDTEGRNVSGPAPSPLPSFRAERSGDMVRVFLKAEGER